ncbi:ATPase, T2SS/T4P/T4SS family [Neptunomonas phycophila]|uniref:ATPase, T2SS/T4P/T4SS family n=1 Tax=Neptunomonas phycophila TaxID=1572645 RepID=UPI003513ABFB
MDMNSVSDLFIPAENVEETRLFSNGTLVEYESISSDIQKQIQPILDACLSLQLETGEDNYLSWSDNNTFRVHLESRRQGFVYCLRSQPTFRPSLIEENANNIKFPKLLVELINKNADRHGGLFIVAGSLGVGKSTTCAGILNHFLCTSGGVGWAIEDPPEYNLEGSYGTNGACFQHHVKDGDFATSIRSMMRCFPASAPATLLIGEIRDEKTAMETLKALLNGTRVIFSFHSSSPVDAITRFLSMCESSEYARQILADSLRLLVFQEKRREPGNKVSVKFDYIEGNSGALGAIRTGNMNSMKDIYIQQKNSRAFNQS